MNGLACFCAFIAHFVRFARLGFGVTASGPACGSLAFFLRFDSFVSLIVRS
jgi:hypothetical protein